MRLSIIYWLFIKSIGNRSNSKLERLVIRFLSINIWLQLVFISEVKEATNWNSNVDFLAEALSECIRMCCFICNFLSAARSEIKLDMGKRIRKTTRHEVVWTREQCKGMRGKMRSHQTDTKRQNLSYTDAVLQMYALQSSCLQLYSIFHLYFDYILLHGYWQTIILFF